jgi:hypothetical protein
MNRTNLSALVLSAVLLLNGCASTNLNGQPSPTTGQDVARAIIGIAIVGGIIALAANQERKPDAVIQTTGPMGVTTSNIYIK